MADKLRLIAGSVRVHGAVSYTSTWSLIDSSYSRPMKTQTSPLSQRGNIFLIRYDSRGSSFFPTMSEEQALLPSTLGPIRQVDELKRQPNIAKRAYLLIVTALGVAWGGYCLLLFLVCLASVRHIDSSNEMTARMLYLHHQKYSGDTAGRTSIAAAFRRSFLA